MTKTCFIQLLVALLQIFFLFIRIVFVMTKMNDIFHVKKIQYFRQNGWVTVVSQSAQICFHTLFISLAILFLSN